MDFWEDLLRCEDNVDLEEIIPEFIWENNLFCFEVDEVLSADPLQVVYVVASKNVSEYQAQVARMSLSFDITRSLRLTSSDTITKSF